jgi:predicted secreted protein
VSKPFILAAALAATLGMTAPTAAKNARTDTVHLSDIKKHCHSLVLQFSGENVTDPNAISSSKEGEKTVLAKIPAP